MQQRAETVLYVFGGLPGTGKTTLARVLAQELKAVYLRIDTIEHALLEAGVGIAGPEGYLVAYRLAADNLRVGLSVVADSVNPLQLTRAAWREVGTGVGSEYVEIEVVCSDVREHRHRVQSRSSDLAGLILPVWDEVVNRQYEPWETDHLILDTAGQTVEQSIKTLRDYLKLAGE